MKLYILNLTIYYLWKK